MKIDRLRLRAFRGISGELRLDLTSPLTLLYAPNGTGKTSICDAVEWLLTGRVGRMGHKLGTAGRDLRCRFSQDRTTLGGAQVRTNGKTSKRLRRELREQGSQLRHYRPDRPPNQRWPLYRSSEALKWCAPLAPRHARGGKIPTEDARRWLRATHFLEGPSLSFLIEASEEAEETRRLLFAQLLGIGEIESRDQFFARLLEPLRSELHRLEHEIDELEAARRSRRKPAKAASFPPAELERRAEEARAVARRALGRYLPNPPTEMPLLRVALETENDGLENQRRALRHLRTHLSGWKNLEIRIENGRQRITALEARREDDQPRLLTLETKLEEASTAHLDHTSRVAAIEAITADVGQLRHDFDRSLEEWTGLLSSDALTEEVRLGPVVAGVEDLERELDQVGGRYDRLRQCREELPGWQRAYAESRRQSERIGRLRRKLEDDERLDTRRLALESLAERRERRLREQDDLGAALDRLRLLLGAGDEGPDVGSKGGRDGGQCPLCGHDHGAPDVLRQAIRTTVEAAPDALRQRSRAIEAIQKEIASHHERLEEQDQLRRRLARSEAQHAETTAELAAALERLETVLPLPVGEADLEGSGLASHLEDLYAEEGRVLEGLRSDAESAGQRLRAGTKLRGGGLALAEVSERLAQLVSVDLPPISRPIPAVWLERLAQIEALADRARRAEIDRLATAGAEKERLSREREQVKARLAEADERLGSLSKDLSEALEKSAALEESWKVLGAPESTPGEASLGRVRERLERLAEDLEHAGGALEKASRLQREAEEAERARRESEDLSRRLASRRQERRRLDTWVSDLEAARRALTAERSRYIKRQIEPLSAVISAIYRRAQGNEVVDRIEPRRQGSGVDELLGWRPQVGSEELDISQLSLGQRQDLALAIFLARARSLGGSFFLDEPLIHLDDLNRVALLDILRVLALDAFSASPESPELRLVITTASSALMRHFREKLSLVPWSRKVPPLRIYELEGDPRQGVKEREIRVPEDPSIAAWREHEGDRP